MKEPNVKHSAPSIFPKKRTTHEKLLSRVSFLKPMIFFMCAAQIVSGPPSLTPEKMFLTVLYQVF